MTTKASNEGASSRVAKSIALKTYSSGPRGGLEGTAALAQVYGLPHALMMDIGGTTTDVGVVEGGAVAVAERGGIVSDPGGRRRDHRRPAVSGRRTRSGLLRLRRQTGHHHRRQLLGILDPDTYLDGTFTLDPRRSRAVITETIAQPLGISLEEAPIRMEHAFFQALSESFAALVTGDTTLLAFGGAGPMSATGAARLAGVKQVLVPRTAAVFSAFGISFSDIGKTYEVIVAEPTTEAATETHDALLARAERDMFQEGYALADCETSWQLLVENLDDGSVSRVPYQPGDDVDYPGAVVSLQLNAAAPLTHPHLTADAAVTVAAVPAAGTRQVRSSPGRDHRGSVPHRPSAARLVIPPDCRRRPAPQRQVLTPDREKGDVLCESQRPNT